ncbi:acyl-CoA dehydrogenase family protein [Sandarakinorhabdus sp.]|uniref:acyl-CoA dehydrogenase family protein n=1 Tax=Sandarakinorhabdus sp. TaxID=1916663 RepID=UPI00286D9D18|nr:acyl-CoA dehydrogenase family protein [Sandarakinorhabdus sp.]
MTLSDLPGLMAQANADIAVFLAAATANVRAQVAGPDGRIDRARIQSDQHLVHGLAWAGALAQTLVQVESWAMRLMAQGRFGSIEALLAQGAFASFGGELQSGIQMAQGETVRPGLLAQPDLSGCAALSRLVAAHDAAARAAITAHLLAAQGEAVFGDDGLDGDLAAIRDQFHAFAQREVAPHAHGWHLADALIPMPLVDQLGALGVFGLTIPERFGGAGLGKAAMCVVSEQLSRGWIGVGSLATRAEIAAELILSAGTPAQQTRWLPGIASGAVLPTAVFTEPGTGSDLGALTTRAVATDGGWQVHGAKTWITHGARADLMTLLVRTEAGSSGQTGDHRGLSMLLAPKPRGTDADPFPAAGMSGSEIGVIGYRGMKEYEIAFDGFAVPADALLGGVRGRGFVQLMATFESARIQTAARAIGVAQGALDAALDYAAARRQFGQPLVALPRVSDKLARMAVEIMAVRQLTLAAAAAKDSGQRCDREAGMAKLLAARTAWMCADNGVQIHGGNGFALEYPASRLLADARILSIFEGSAEIQADVIARRMLETG